MMKINVSQLEKIIFSLIKTIGFYLFFYIFYNWMVSFIIISQPRG